MDLEKELIRLASVSVEISPPGEIVQERKQGWERLFEKFETKFVDDEEFSLKDFTKYAAKRTKLDNGDHLYRSKDYQNYLSSQMDLALEVATQSGNLIPAEDEEDIGIEEEESDEYSEDDFHTSERDIFSSPPNGSPGFQAVQSPLAGSTPRCSDRRLVEGTPRRYAEVAGSPRKWAETSQRGGRAGAGSLTTPPRDNSASPRKFILNSCRKVGSPVQRINEAIEIGDQSYKSSWTPFLQSPPRSKEDVGVDVSDASSEADVSDGVVDGLADVRICTTCSKFTVYPKELELDEVETDPTKFLCDTCLMSSKHEDCVCETCKKIETKATWRWILLDCFLQNQSKSTPV